MTPVAEPSISDLEREYVADAVASGLVSGGGPYVDRFEEMLCKHTGARWAVAVMSGTAALHVAVQGMIADYASTGLATVRSLNFIAVANALSYCGIGVELSDVGASWTPDHSAVGRVIDAAPSIAKVPLARGSLTCLSFNGNKTITTGQGGAILGMSEWQEEIVRSLVSVCKVPDAPDHYEFDAVGFNYRMPNVNAAIGCAQMERLPGFLAAKRRIMARYRNAGIRMLDSTWMAVADLGDRSRAIAALTAAGAAAKPFWKPLHLQKPYAHCVRGPMTRTDALWRRLVCLPCSVALTDDDQDKVIKCAASL